LGEQISVNVDGDQLPVSVRRNAQAKRLILRVERVTGEIKLTVPTRVSNRAAERFVRKQIDWIAAERAAVGPVQKLCDGMQMPFLGKVHQLRFTNEPPRKIQREADEIQVGGPADMASKRLEAWLRREAKALLSERTSHHAETLGVQYNRVSIGDMKSRWGSCSSRGTLRFSWRLLMAPYDVMDYVAAHEVAHLLEMNHSDRFWAHVGRCVPEHKSLRRWLKTEGGALFKLRF